MRYAVKHMSSYSAVIFIAGDSEEARRICREFCNDVGLCVNVTDVDYIYTGGEQSGVRVELIQYPMYPTPEDEIDKTAFDLGMELLKGLNQETFSIMDDNSVETIVTEKSDYYEQF